MLTANLWCICTNYLLLSLIIWMCAGYAYLVNRRLPAGDPNRKGFHFSATLLAPITWPFFMIASILLFIIRALLFGVSLFLFTLALVFIRKPFILIWLDRAATRIGNKLLTANTSMLNFMLGRTPSVQ